MIPEGNQPVELQPPMAVDRVVSRAIHEKGDASSRSKLFTGEWGGKIQRRRRAAQFHLRFFFLTAAENAGDCDDEGPDEQVFPLQWMVSSRTRKTWRMPGPDRKSTRLNSSHVKISY